MRARNAGPGARLPASAPGPSRAEEAAQDVGRGTGANRRLAEMAWPEVAEAVRAGATTVILPLGANEQHGPHLPLGTDTVRAAALAEGLAGKLGTDALVAPALPFGCSDEHWGFPGLLGVDAETFARVVLDLARRLAGWGVRRLVLLSAHGGNGEALGLALTLLRRELPEIEALTNEHLESIAPALLEVARRDGISASDVGLHAGEGETSEMLCLRPDLVRPDAAAAGFTGDMEAVMDRLREVGLRAVTETGVLGDPTRAEARRGALYLDVVTEDLAALARGGDGGS